MHPFSRRLRLFLYRESVDFELSRMAVPLSKYMRCGEDYLRPSPIPLKARDPERYELVNDPGRADFIVFPFGLHSLIYRCGLHGSRFPANDPEGNARVLSFLTGLPFYREAEEKHVFFTGHDWDGPRGVQCVVVNESVAKTDENPNRICAPHWVEDIAGGRLRPQIRRHTSFVGNMRSHASRRVLLEGLRSHLLASPDFSLFVDAMEIFHEFLPREAAAERRDLFLRIMGESLTVLCPRGHGLNSIRFFEAMCLGRVPILISDGCALPLEDEIDWDSLILRIPEGEAGNAGPLLSEWFAERGARRLEVQGLKNRMVWEQFFTPEKSPEFYFNSLHKILAARNKE